MCSANVSVLVAGLDFDEDGAGVTVCGLRLGGSMRRGIEFGLNPGIGLDVAHRGIGAWFRGDIGVRDGLSLGMNVHSLFGAWNAEAGTVGGWDYTHGSWSESTGDAYDASVDPAVREQFRHGVQDRLEEVLGQRLPTHLQRGINAPTGAASFVSPGISSSDTYCPNCGELRSAVPFCSVSGERHELAGGICNSCGQNRAACAFCPATGRRHDDLS